MWSLVCCDSVCFPQQVFQVSAFRLSPCWQPVESIFCEDTKPLLLAVKTSFYCYLFGTSSPACRPAASPAAASPAPASAPTPAARAAQVSKVDLQLRCDVVGWFAEVVITGLVSVARLKRTDDNKYVSVWLHSVLCFSKNNKVIVYCLAPTQYLQTLFPPEQTKLTWTLLSISLYTYIYIYMNRCVYC